MSHNIFPQNVMLWSLSNKDIIVEFPIILDSLSSPWSLIMWANAISAFRFTLSFIILQYISQSDLYSIPVFGDILCE